MAICPTCGTENPDGFRFCPACGVPLTVAVVASQRRKVVTALFCDVTGSTALGEELDPEVLRGVMNRYFAEIRATIERHGGTVDKFIGDAVMAVFGIPRVNEDDALRAVRAAAEIRRRLPAIAEQVGVALRFRTGVNTGPVFVGEGENLAIGDAVNVAARLEQAAEPGEIVLGPDTLRLVRDAVQVEALEPLSLKGKSEPVTAFRLLSVDPSAPGVARHLGSPLVGREREFRWLAHAWDRAVEDSACHLFTLLGVAGVGKSRLVAEFLSAVGERATVLRGRCLHYGEGITFWPLVEALTSVGERAQDVLDRLHRGGSATPEELFWEVRRLLESMAAERPLILHIDDVQWAEPMLADLLDHVADLSRGTPILLLCTARPELLESRPEWAGGKLNATTVLLEPLAREDAEALLDQLGHAFDPGARSQIVAAGAGNPLFLEEMASLARERGRVEVPATIQALLAARLEHLGPQERELLERGAVEGEVFHRLPLRAMADGDLAASIEPRLAGLVRKELIRPYAPTLYGGEAFRFRHLLIRDAAYDGLAKASRADLHERFASWLRENASDLAEFDEIAGWHLEQAVEYRRELGHAVEPALARHAAEHLHTAGNRALGRNDVAAARNLLGRAIPLLTEPDPLHAAICVELAELLISDVGELARANELLAVAERNPQTAQLATLPRLEWLLAARPRGAVESIEAQLPEVIERFARAGDERGLAKAHLVAWSAHWLGGRTVQAAAEARLAAEHALAAGDLGLRSRALSSLLPPLVRGPQHAREIAKVLDELERDESGPSLAARLMLTRAWVARLDGRFNEARTAAQRASEDFAALGQPRLAAGSAEIVAEIDVAAGELTSARAHLLEADAVAAVLDEVSYRSTVQAQLADVEARLGDPAAARVAIEFSEQLTAPEDVINYAITHSVRARLALADGHPEAAERWARSAVRHAFVTDQPQTRADAELELARILAGLDRPGEAAVEARVALSLYTSKGDRPGALATQALIDQLSDCI